jgi:hypothetical protein
MDLLTIIMTKKRQLEKIFLNKKYFFTVISLR